MRTIKEILHTADGITDKPMDLDADALNDALNIIGMYCHGRLRDGWRLTMHVDGDEQWFELTDEDGTDQEHWQSDESCPVIDAIEYASQYGSD